MIWWFCVIKQELPYSYIEYKTITEQRNYTLSIGQSATCAEIGITENSKNSNTNMTVVVDYIGVSCESACNGASNTVPSLSETNWQLFAIIGGSIVGGILLVFCLTPVVMVCVYFARKKKLWFVYDEDKYTLPGLFDKINKESDEEIELGLYEEMDNEEGSNVHYRKWFRGMGIN